MIRLLEEHAAGIEVMVENDEEDHDRNLAIILAALYE